MRKGYWKCSLCGMQSTRRWNVLRHINRQHQGNADTLYSASRNARGAGANRYTFAAQPDISPPQKLPDPVLTEKYGSRPRIQHVVERHLHECLKQRMESLSRVADSYRGSICDNCLTIDLVPAHSGQNHYCNTLWLLDYTELTNHKAELKEYIKTHMPVYLARAIREQNKGRVELNAWRMDDFPEYDPASFKHTPPPGSDPKLKPYYDVVNIYEELSRDPKRDWIKPIRLGSLNKNHWALRAITDGETRLNQSELTEFISMGGGNVAIFKVNKRLYLMFVEILIH